MSDTTPNIFEAAADISPREIKIYPKFVYLHLMDAFSAALDDPDDKSFFSVKDPTDLNIWEGTLFGSGFLIDPFFSVANLGQKRTKKFKSLLDALIKLTPASKSNGLNRNRFHDLEENTRNVLYMLTSAPCSSDEERNFESVGTGLAFLKLYRSEQIWGWIPRVQNEQTALAIINIRVLIAAFQPGSCNIQGHAC
ncbi:hypothetical protein B0H19DRAFT_1063053 [Mycena capillaripes]|nr:hypothetical protein B0H19DRAFT_1063053 [Mycena capillaripes]